MGETNAKSHKTDQVTHPTCFSFTKREILWNMSVRKDFRIHRTLPEWYFISFRKMQERVDLTQREERVREGSGQGRLGDKKGWGVGRETSGLSGSSYETKFKIALTWENQPPFLLLQVFEFKPHSSRVQSIKSQVKTSLSSELAPVNTDTEHLLSSLIVLQYNSDVFKKECEYGKHCFRFD